tara:strand:+ start:806 stop:988 length:183 start_codon:yes stop_codon:yes gene_type:complete
MCNQERNKMKYQITFTAMWNTEIEANSREEAEEILERDWDKLISIDSSFMNIEADLFETE